LEGINARIQAVSCDGERRKALRDFSMFWNTFHYYVLRNRPVRRVGRFYDISLFYGLLTSILYSLVESLCHMSTRLFLIRYSRYIVFFEYPALRFKKIKTASDVSIFEATTPQDHGDIKALARSAQNIMKLVIIL
jgi:hypothetical protein